MNATIKLMEIVYIDNNDDLYMIRAFSNGYPNKEKGRKILNRLGREYKRVSEVKTVFKDVINNETTINFLTNELPINHK